MPLNDWRSLGSLDQYSMLKKLQTTSDPSYQATLALVKKISNESDTYPSKRDSKLVDNFNLDKNAKSCEAMLKPIVAVSEPRTNAIAAYLGGGTRPIWPSKNTLAPTRSRSQCLRNAEELS